jgi:quinol monooxygenase YgiN
MPVFKIARYEVRPEERSAAEADMREFAAYVGKELRDSGWVTYRDRANPNRYVSLVSAADAAADDRHRAAEGTKKFVQALYPRLVGEVEFTDYELVVSSDPVTG